MKEITLKELTERLNEVYNEIETKMTKTSIALEEAVQRASQDDLTGNLISSLEVDVMTCKARLYGLENVIHNAEKFAKSVDDVKKFAQRRLKTDDNWLGFGTALWVIEDLERN